MIQGETLFTSLCCSRYKLHRRVRLLWRNKPCHLRFRNVCRIDVHARTTLSYGVEENLLSFISKKRLIWFWKYLHLHFNSKSFTSLIIINYLFNNVPHIIKYIYTFVIHNTEYIVMIIYIILVHVCTLLSTEWMYHIDIQFPCKQFRL